MECLFFQKMLEGYVDKFAQEMMDAYYARDKQEFQIAKEKLKVIDKRIQQHEKNHEHEHIYCEFFRDLHIKLELLDVRHSDAGLS